MLKENLVNKTQKENNKGTGFSTNSTIKNVFISKTDYTQSEQTINPRSGPFVTQQEILRGTGRSQINFTDLTDRKSTRLNSSPDQSRMPSSA